jgi:hypothetical protein
MIICATFDDLPKNYGSPGADFIGLKQIRNECQRKSVFLLRATVCKFLPPRKINE